MRQFAVIGLGRFGSSIAKTLSEKGCQVLAIDTDEDKVQDFSEIVAQAVCLDATDEKALRAVGIENIDVAVVSVGNNIESSILITLMLKEIGIKEVIAKSVTEEQGKVLKRVGADKIIFPERDMGIRLASALTSPGVSEFIGLSSECSIIEIEPPDAFIGKTLKQLNLRVEAGLNIIAIKNKDKAGHESVNPIPEADYKIGPEDKLIIVGPNKNIEIFEKRK
ncbi:MAG: TrkA family potassium uptake protein [Candidatus Omnitrophota bacterium]